MVKKNLAATGIVPEPATFGNRRNRANAVGLGASARAGGATTAPAAPPKMCFYGKLWVPLHAFTIHTVACPCL